MEQNTKELGTQSINQLLAKFSIPAIIAMVINAVYNIVDRIFIGQFVGEEALAALTIAFPVMMVVFAVATLIGQGGANLISIRLGEKDKRRADHVFTNTIVMTLICGLITIGLGFIFLDPILSILGAEGAVFDYGKGYLSVIFIGLIFQLLGFVFNSIVRAEGFPVLSMISMIASGVTNMILDYIFIGPLNMGVEGAALATIIGQFLGFCILISHFLRKKSSLQVHAKDLAPDIKVVGKIFAVGSPTFATSVGSSVAMMVLNSSLAKYGGTPAVTSMGAINSLYTLFIMPILGIQGGVQPIIGFNYGAKYFKRVKEALYKSIGIGTVFAIVVFGLLMINPTLFISMFLESGSETIPIAVNGLRIYIAMLPLLSINIFGIAYFQAIAQSRQALFLGLLRQFLILIPIVIILPRIFGLNGVWFATPVADFLAIVITLAMLIPSVRKLKKQEEDTCETEEVLV